jgi:hypothetical protein
VPGLSDLANLEELSGVEKLWFADYYDGPVDGLASFRDREYWYSAVWEDGRGVYTDFPRLFIVYELTDQEAADEWADHRGFMYDVGGAGCLHSPPCATNLMQTPDARARWEADRPSDARTDHTHSRAVGWFSDGRNLSAAMNEQER